MIAQVFDTSNTLTVAAAVVIALLGGGGIYALLKVRPEASKISVDAAQGAVIVQTGVIDSLREENTRLANRLSEVERTSADVNALMARVQQLEDERTQLQRENARLMARVKHLEDELRKVMES